MLTLGIDDELTEEEVLVRDSTFYDFSDVI